MSDKTEEQLNLFQKMLDIRESNPSISWKEIADLVGVCSANAARKKFARAEKKFGADAQAYVEQQGIDPNDVRGIWSKTKGISVYTKYDPAKKTPEDFFEAYKELIGFNVPSLTVKTAPFNEDGCLLVVDPADIHLGKLSSQKDNKYNIEIALACAKEGIQGVLEMSKGFNITQCMLVIGNDILHVDTPRRTTTSGTPQDTDGMWFDAYIAAGILYREVIKWLLEFADVHVVFNPSNHDWMTGACLAVGLEGYFHEYDRVTFDTDIQHRKYYKFGQCLIGSTHGDGAKMTDLPLLMAQESKDLWAETKYRYWLVHHLHHMRKSHFKSGQDFVGATVRYMRSPSCADRWHDDNGFTGGKRAVEGMVFHPSNGQIAELTHNF